METPGEKDTLFVVGGEVLVYDMVGPLRIGKITKVVGRKVVLGDHSCWKGSGATAFGSGLYPTTHIEPVTPEGLLVLRHRVVVSKVVRIRPEEWAQMSADLLDQVLAAVKVIRTKEVGSS